MGRWAWGGGHGEVGMERWAWGGGHGEVGMGRWAWGGWPYVQLYVYTVWDSYVAI